ncbi:MAG TPA: hypothetical protein VNT31_01310 [Nocardioides sp.]|nr:hypothetical protein [Nocardioides sp.]
MNTVHNPLRRSYEAKVLVVPLGNSADALTRSLTDHGLNGVQMLTQPAQTGAGTEVLGESAWPVPAGAGTTGLASEADMIVFVGGDLAEVPVDLVHEVCTAAKEAGRTSAAVLLNASHWEQADGSAAMKVLRQDVDMVVSVQDAKYAAALIDVLRGGARAESHEQLEALS